MTAPVRYLRHPHLRPVVPYRCWITAVARYFTPCARTADGWICCRPTGHTGRHYAAHTTPGGGLSVVAVFGGEP